MTGPFAEPEGAEAQAEAAKTTKAAASTTTPYLILSKSASAWAEQETVNARSAKEAIRTFLGGVGNPDGTYVAVPARSWRPIVVKTETQTKITLT